ncbi:energy transducer TonB [Oscillatoria salina]|uniref:energy transducer TonB n=1 Tax=Oscillatoria salina TaxID=331517 RepID=UPI0013BCA94D|nr:energy transducer TonB [Oscillatoria salina]MBZ8182400.1 TonB family protein [Oscillatoria salina IIICB1]NET91096.1 TonB family protein [Kamptonema sp. SIO1D9]
MAISYSSIIKTLPDKLTQPATLAVFASVGIHGLLGVSLPNLPLFSATPNQGTLRDVRLVELSETEQSRLPDLSPQLNPSELPHLSQLLPVQKSTTSTGTTKTPSTVLPSTPTKNLSIDKSVTLGNSSPTKVPLPPPPPTTVAKAGGTTTPGKTQYEIERSQRLSLFANSPAHTASTKPPLDAIQDRIAENNAQDIAKVNNLPSPPPTTEATPQQQPPEPNLVQPTNGNNGNNYAIAREQTIPSNTLRRDDTIPTFESNSSDGKVDKDLTTALVDLESTPQTTTTEDKQKSDKNLAVIAEQITNSSTPEVSPSPAEDEENKPTNPQVAPTVPTSATPVTPPENSPNPDSPSPATRQRLNRIQINPTEPSNSDPNPVPTDASILTPEESTNNSSPSPASSLGNIQADPAALQERIQNLETESSNRNNQQAKAKSPTWETTVAQIPPQEQKLTGIYPENACAKKLEGNVIYGVLVDSQGNIADLELIKGTAYQVFNQQALEQIKERKFAPATGQAQPYKINVEFKYNQANCPAQNG